MPKDPGFEVHHKVPLEGGGDNSFDNLLVIKADPFHKALTREYDILTAGWKAGDSGIFKFSLFQSVFAYGGNWMVFKQAVRDRIAAISAEQEKFGIPRLIGPISVHDLNVLIAAVKIELGIDLPRAYQEFLCVQNGGGEHVGLYGNRTYVVERNGERSCVDGIVEENVNLRSDYPTMKTLLAIGRCDHEHLIYIPETGRCEMRRLSDNSVYETFNDVESAILFSMT